MEIKHSLIGCKYHNLVIKANDVTMDLGLIDKKEALLLAIEFIDVAESLVDKFGDKSLDAFRYKINNAFKLLNKE